MSGLVSYSYDPNSEQEASDSPLDYPQEESVKKEQTQIEKRQEHSEREKRRIEDRNDEVSREREHASRRRDRDTSPHRKYHKHHRHRRSRHSSSDSDSPDRHRSRKYRESPGRHSRSPRRRHDDRDPSDRSYRSRRGYTPPRTITSARSPPRSNPHHWQGSMRQEGDNSTSVLNSTVTNSGIPIQPGNPYGMSQEKFRNLQSKKKLLWSKDTEEDTSATKGSVYIAATSSLPVNQDKKDKFSKMMGLKSPNLDHPHTPSLHNEMVHYDKTSEDLQKQYDASRVHTHMMKGSGLGYGNIYQV